WTHPPSKPRAAFLAAGLVTAVCAWLTVLQIGVWKDSPTLFAHVIRQLGDDPYRADIYWRLGVAQLTQGQRAEAIRSFRHGLEIDPHETVAHHNLANIAFKAGNYEEA